MFSHGSRYARIGEATYTFLDGTSVAYKLRRLVPEPGPVIQSLVTVEPDDRPDLVAARTIGDPLLFWRIADANLVANPFELTAVPGRVLTVPIVQL